MRCLTVCDDITVHVRPLSRSSGGGDDERAGRTASKHRLMPRWRRLKPQSAARGVCSSFGVASCGFPSAMAALAAAARIGCVKRPRRLKRFDALWERR